RLARDGTISVGELVAGVGLAQFLIGPLERLTELGAVLAGARGAARRTAAVLAAPPAVTAGTGVLPARPAGTLRVRLPDGPALEVAAGEHVGVVTLQAADAARLPPPPAVTAGTGVLPARPAGTLRVRLPDGPALEVAAGEHVGVVTLQAADAARLLDALARDADAPVELDGTDLRGVALDEAR